MKKLKTWDTVSIVLLIIAWQKHQWQTSETWLEVAESIGKIALTIFAYPIFIFADLTIVPIARLIDRCCSPRRLWTLNSEGKRVPSAPYIEHVLENRFSNFPYNDNAQLFKNALRKTFSYNTPEFAASYKQLILANRLLEGENPTTIHLGCAQWLLAHYLLVKDALLRGHLLYPGVHPHRDNPYFGNVEEGQRPRDDAGLHEHDVARLSRIYQMLNNKDRASVLLQIMTPSVQWELSDAAKILTTDIREIALNMIADHAFLDIYRAALPDVNNI